MAVPSVGWGRGLACREAGGVEWH
eukprot:gene26839-biopygen17428